MQVLVLNSGSSSIKFKLFKMPEETKLCAGLIERIGHRDAKFTFSTQKETLQLTRDIPNHKVGLEILAKKLLHKDSGIINSTDDINIVGHRVVHGGKLFRDTTEITQAVKDKIKSLSTLAPLHNPPNLEGIEVAETIFKKAKQVAVFDTAFHQSIPDYANKYAIPIDFSEKHSIRVYGFHGISHEYVSEKAIQYLGKKHSKIISLHLGNGCSITALKDGKSMDNSQGFSPINGLIMGTRSGDVDPSIIFHLAEKYDYSIDEISTLLQKKSGMFGLTGYNDLRDIKAEAKKGNKACQLALEMNIYRIKKYIGAYAAVLNGLDAIVFTAGIGENSSYMRQHICEDMDFLGISLDEEKNNFDSNTGIKAIHSDTAKVKLLVIPTNEELEIAKQACDLLANNLN
ncbi:acetate kinase [Oceanihabitans sp. IOP_32]|uniref:acetate/propionate family kinase n=1 Tax=Oceanihabitans sp. IOP_32 TaxID=2529032 RepID=UPI001292F040|nr:acetate kinase [Oceanihabitans sp. IOP_32]QFZ53899.1 acetate kinase [Oceanihabitans sp. IOP_32]